MQRLIVASIAAACLSLPSNAGAAVDAGTKCQQSKIKARASLARCLAKSAAGMIAGDSDASPGCRDKLRKRNKT